MKIYFYRIHFSILNRFYCFSVLPFPSHSIMICRNHYGENDQKYADTLLDYGFFLLNVDAINRSVHAYTVIYGVFAPHSTAMYWCSTICSHISVCLQRALDIKRYIHGNKNLAVATAEEDLSYALYVLEYSSGNFQSAKDHICKSIDILKVLLPTDHLLLSSARRVKALILEEIALDSFFVGEASTGNLFVCLYVWLCVCVLLCVCAHVDGLILTVNTITIAFTNLSLTSFYPEYQNLLIEAEELHQSALKITIDAFGEVNVQTAKHYGNLGRLYQSMAKYEVSFIFSTL